MSRRTLWTILGVVFAVALGVGLSLRPLVRGVLEREAARRGFVLETSDLALGFGRVTLEGARVGLEGTSGVSASLGRVTLDLRLLDGPLGAVSVEGGQVHLAGSLEELRARLEAWQARHTRQSGPSSSATQSARPARARALRVDWPLGPNEAVSIEGLSIDRLPGAPLRVGADLVTVRGPLGRVDAAGTDVRLGSNPGGLFAEAVRLGEVRASLRVADDPEEGTPPAKSSKTDPNAAAEEAGLAQRLRVDRERPARVRAVLATARHLLSERLPSSLEIERLWLGVESGSERLALGPSRLSVEKTEAALAWSLVPGEDTRGTPLEVKGTFPLSGDTPVRAELSGGPVSLQQLGVREGDFGLVGVGRATLAGKTKVELDASGELLRAAGSITVSDLAVSSARIAEETISVPSLLVRGDLEARIDGSRYALTNAELGFGQAHFDGRFEISRQDARVVLDAGFRAPLVACQALLDSAPRALLGSVRDMRWSGTFSLDAAVLADSSQLSKMRVAWSFDNGCKVTSVPASLDPERFREPFEREVLGPGGIPHAQEFGPGTSSWVPLDDISPYMEAALLVTEDGRFFKHHGFDDRAIEASIMANARAGSFVRGASTLSMQLAKNLYLSRTRILSRKLQEAALTILLEQNFTKKELLELYLNVVEFGPGIYGIGPAASYYFKKSPRDLTPAQAFFLGSILPNPTVQYFGSDGLLSAARKRHIESLLRISNQRGRLSAPELDQALTEVLRFGEPETVPPQADAPPPTPYEQP